MAKQDFSAKSGNFVDIVLTIDFYCPRCLLSESAGWILVNFERFLKMGEIQDGHQRPF